MSARAVQGRGWRRGMSLVEVVIAVVVLAFVLVGGMNSIGAAVKQQAVLVEQARGVALAQDLLNEIMVQSYVDSVAPTFGPEVGETRRLYDDVDDYHGLTESPPIEGLDLLGTTWAGWKRVTRVKYASMAAPETLSGSDAGLKHVTVEVTAPSGKIYTVVGLRAKAGLYEKVADSSGAYTARVGVAIELGGDVGTAMQQSAAMTNTVR